MRTLPSGSTPRAFRLARLRPRRPGSERRRLEETNAPGAVTRTCSATTKADVSLRLSATLHRVGRSHDEWLRSRPPCVGQHREAAKQQEQRRRLGDWSRVIDQQRPRRRQPGHHIAALVQQLDGARELRQSKSQCQRRGLDGRAEQVVDGLARVARSYVAEEKAQRAPVCLQAHRHIKEGVAERAEGDLRVRREVIDKEECATETHAAFVLGVFAPVEGAYGYRVCGRIDQQTAEKSNARHQPPCRKSDLPKRGAFNKFSYFPSCHVVLLGMNRARSH